MIGVPRAVRKRVYASIRQAEVPSDPQTRFRADREARRLVTNTPLMACLYVFLVFAQIPGIVEDNSTFRRALGVFCLVVFSYIFVYMLILWRRAKRYLVVSNTAGPQKPLPADAPDKTRW